MKQYLELLQHVLDNGELKGDRTGTGTRSVFGYQMRFNLQEGFPLLTTKKVWIPMVIHELLYFLKGDTNIQYLKDNKVNIWNEWADENGDIGPMYPFSWRGDGMGGYPDQIYQLMQSLRNFPDSRRHVVSSWLPDLLPDDYLSPQENVEAGFMALAPCHCLFQFYISDGKLSCQLYQRSADTLLGLPVNIASYSLLTHMIAQQLGLEVGDFIFNGGDVHLYNNHIDQAKLQLTRTPDELCKLEINTKPESIFDYKFDMFDFVGYNPQEAIKAPISV